MVVISLIKLTLDITSSAPSLISQRVYPCSCLSQLAGALMNLQLKKNQATGQQLLAQTGEILKQPFMHGESRTRAQHATIKEFIH